MRGGEGEEVRGCRGRGRGEGTEGGEEKRRERRGQEKREKEGRRGRRGRRGEGREERINEERISPVYAIGKITTEVSLKGKKMNDTPLVRAKKEGRIRAQHSETFSAHERKGKLTP